MLTQDVGPLFRTETTMKRFFALSAVVASALALMAPTASAPCAWAAS